jgi:hypothetical protein
MARGDIKVRLLGDISDLSDSLSEAGNRVGEFASGFASKAGLALAGGGLAAGALFVERFGEGLNFDASIDRLSAGLGLTEDAAALAGDAAASLYSNAWGDSLDEVSAAIGSVAQNDLVDLETAAQGTVEDITAGVLDIAKVMDEDFGAATRAAGQLVRTGLADDATQALDLIAAGVTTGADRAEDFLDTLNEYSPAFQRLGFDGETAIGLISQGLDAGAFNADKIGDAFNEFSIRAIDGSTATVDALSELGLSADDVAQRIAEGGPAAQQATSDIIAALSNVDDKVTQDAAGVALFGSIWEDLGADVILALDPAAASVENLDGAAARMGDTLNDNLGTKIETLKRTALTGLTTFMTDNVIPAAEAVMDAYNEDGLAGVFDTVAEGIENALPVIGDKLQDMGEAIVDWVVEQGPKIANKIVAWIASFTEWIGENRREMLRRLGLLISDVLQWILDHVDDIAAKLLEWAAAFVAWIIPVIGDMLADLGWMLGQLLSWIVTDALPQIVAKLAEWAGAFASWVADAAVQLIAQIPTLVSNAAAAGGRAGEALVNRFVDWLRGLPGQARDWAVAAGRAIRDGVLSGLGNIAGSIRDRIFPSIPGIGGWFRGSSAGGGVADESAPAPFSGAGSMFGAAAVVPGFGGIDATFGQPPQPSLTIVNNFGPGTNPVEAGREIEELLYRFASGGGTVRVTSTDPLVATVGG